MDDEKKPESIDFWMIRPCEIYNNEYSQCTSIMTRLHQVFVHGQTIDCNSKQEDYINCMKWKKEKDIKAAETLIQSEKNKISHRWKSFYANNVWETRTSPPENWNEPLPDYILQRKSNSTLKDTLDEYNDQNDSESFCSIM